jgi:AAA domain/DnaB-like helicase N terminal domain
MTAAAWRADESAIPVPPSNTEAEQALLGAIFVNPVAYSRVAEFLAPEHFFLAVHARIYAAISKLIERGQVATLVTLKNQFDKDGALAEIGGAQYLARLAESAVTIINAEHYGRTIVDLHLRRELITIGQDLVTDAYRVDLDKPASTIIKAAAERLREAERIGAGAGAMICERAEPHSVASIPPRQWAYGTFLLLGQPSVIGAVDGGGKGALATVIALSMITGKELLGERVWRTGPVAIVSYEDDETEWHRRIAAACLHYGLDYGEVVGSFHFIRRSGDRVCLAAPSPTGTIFPDGDAIIAHLKRIGAAMLIVDPFNHAHRLQDGNNNVLIAQVADEASRIAKESGVALLALHHLRKGSTGSPDDLMGATSLRATFRSCRILSRMTAEEAEKLGLPRAQAWRHSRISGSKDNYAPPPDLATWYRLESVSLDNGIDIYQAGDNIQVTTTWAPPSPFADFPLNIIASILDALRKGPSPGEFYSTDKKARPKRWAGDLIIKETGKSEGEAASIIRIWLDNAVLLKGKYTSPERREEIGCVTVNEIKAAEILGALYPPDDGE